MEHDAQRRLRPKLLSFDVFGTLIDVRESSYAAFRSMLADAGGAHVDVKAFWEHWEERNIAHYWEPWRPYKEICELSLAETFAHYGLTASSRLISRYFEAFAQFRLFADVEPTLDTFARHTRLGLVSNIDDDLLAATPLARAFDVVATAERAKGYKPNGDLFRYLVAHAGCDLKEILHAGQSQFTDMVGGKPLGLTICWINRRGIALSPRVPKPDYVFSDVAGLLDLVATGPSP